LQLVDGTQQIFPQCRHGQVFGVLGALEISRYRT
jgi:hypothetical protein